MKTIGKTVLLSVLYAGTLLPAWASNDQSASRLGEMVFSDCPLSTQGQRRYVQCAQLPVPEYSGQAEDDWIELLVVRLPATAARVSGDPVLALAGGPGQAASESFLYLDRQLSELARRRDIYLVDQRGTGQSNPQHCDFAEFDQTMMGDDREQLKEATRACLDQFVGDPRYYTTEQAVQDLERVREALQIKAWNVYAVSYGTRVAQTYMRQYPNAVRSAVLDGVLPASESLGPQIALHSQQALQTFFSQCRSESSCHEQFPELEQSVDRLFTQLGKAPVSVSYESTAAGTLRERSFTRAHLVAVVRMALYNSDVLSVLPPMLDSAANRDDFVALARLAERLDVSKQMALGMHNSVVCTEDVPFYTALDQQKLERTYIGSEMVEALEVLCEEWPTGTVGKDFKTPLDSDIPTLLLSGERDPITPPTYGEQVLDSLSRARHLVVPNRGHHVGFHGCAPTLIARFVEYTDPEALDSNCLERLRPVPLFIHSNGPSP